MPLRQWEGTDAELFARFASWTAGRGWQGVRFWPVVHLSAVQLPSWRGRGGQRKTQQYQKASLNASRGGVSHEQQGIANGRITQLWPIVSRSRQSGCEVRECLLAWGRIGKFVAERHSPSIPPLMHRGASLQGYIQPSSIRRSSTTNKARKVLRRFSKSTLYIVHWLSLIIHKARHIPARISPGP